MDLSKRSTEELMKMRDGGRVDLASMSTEDLMKMRDEPVAYVPSGERQEDYQNPVTRQIGLTGRYLAEGLTAIPNMVGDALGLRSSEAVSGLLTKMGLPQPQGAKERIVGDVSRAIAGQGGVAQVGQGLTKAAGPVARTVGDLLVARPGAQIVGAAGASGSSGATREAGGGPVAQTVAGLAGGLVAPVAADVAGKGAAAAGRGVVAAAKPFTDAGREQVVGETLKRLSTQPDTVAAQLAQPAEIVAGSTPTTAQVARDPGLLTAERAMRSGPSGGRFAEQQSKANQARNLLLNEMAGDEKTLAKAKGLRAANANTAYDEALDEPITASQELIALTKRPAVRAAAERAKAIAAEQGVDLGDPITSVKGLHYMKMALDDTLDSAFSGGIGKAQQRAIADSREELLGMIDKLSPKYKAAREQYAAQSRPVNQMEALQDVRGRVLNPGTDAQSGERIMSAAKFYQAVTKNDAELSKVLSKEQMTGLRSIAKDLDRGALSDSAGKAAGSNTYQNVSTAYVLGRALGGDAPSSPLLQNLLRPLAWLNKLNEPELQKLLTDAMLDPALARTLMGRANPRGVESVALELTQRARALGIGAGQGAAAAQANADTRPER